MNYNNQEKKEYTKPEALFLAMFGWMYTLLLWIIFAFLVVVAPFTIAYKNIVKRYNKLSTK